MRKAASGCGSRRSWSMPPPATICGPSATTGRSTTSSRSRTRSSPPSSPLSRPHLAAGMERAKRNLRRSRGLRLRAARHGAAGRHGRKPMPPRAAFFERAIDSIRLALAHAFLALAIFNEEWGARRKRTRGMPGARAQRRSATGPDRQPIPPQSGHDPVARARVRACRSQSDRGVALNPNDRSAALYRGYILTFSGVRPGVDSFERAIALDPYHPEW